MKIAIIDDQREFHQVVKQRLSMLQNYKINIHSFISVTEFEKSKDVYNLLLLDIDMPDINGVQYAQKHLEQNIVFVSNHGSYMKSAFGPNIYGFIEKSDSTNYFLQTIDRILENILKQKFIEVKIDLGERKLFEKDIIYIQYISRKTMLIKVTNGEYVIKGMGLKDLQSKLDINFINSDRDLIINIDYVIGITNNNEIILKNVANKFHVSTRRITEIKNKFYGRYK